MALRCAASSKPQQISRKKGAARYISGPPLFLPVENGVFIKACAQRPRQCAPFPAEDEQYVTTRIAAGEAGCCNFEAACRVIPTKPERENVLS